MSLLDKIDHAAKGRGLSIAQIKRTRADGSVDYFFSRPELKWYDAVGWLWYVAHKRDLERSRA